MLIAFTDAPVEAQHTDFSGTWNLDRSASEIPQGRGGRRGSGRFPGGGPATVTITQTDDEVVMEQQGGVAIMTSSWDDATLVTEGLRTISTPPRQIHAGKPRATFAE